MESRIRFRGQRGPWFGGIVLDRSSHGRGALRGRLELRPARERKRRMETDVSGSAPDVQKGSHPRTGHSPDRGRKDRFDPGIYFEKRTAVRRVPRPERRANSVGISAAGSEEGQGRKTNRAQSARKGRSLKSACARREQ